MNILLIDVDTLRADHLGCYGYRRPTSPAIDRLAAEGALFERCFAPGIPTMPSHTTMFTGLHPITHQIVSHGGARDLSEKIPLLPELLQQGGMTTCGVDNLFDQKRWFARGFEFYINPTRRRRLGLMVSCEEMNRRAIPWLKAHASEPFFLFVHYWDPHTPYLPPMRFRSLFYEGGDPCDPANRSLEGMERQPFGDMWRSFWFPKLGGHITDGAYVEAMYDGEIRYLDDGISDLLNALDESGVAHDTLVILIGDHGESMYQHDIFFDHHGLYDCNLHVPLLMRWPDRIAAGQRLPPFAQHLDLAPTILSAAGLEVPRSMEGQNLLPIATGQTETPTVNRVITEECTWQAKWGIRTDTHKFILSRQPDYHGMPRVEMYDLRSDPDEVRNLVEEQPQLAADFEAELEEWIALKLKSQGRSVDPLLEQGITLGKRWARKRAEE